MDSENPPQIENQETPRQEKLRETNFGEILKHVSKSWIVKAFAIGSVCLCLMIPLSMVRDTVRERSSRFEQVKNEISQLYAPGMYIKGPVIVIPYLLKKVSYPEKDKPKITYIRKYRYIMSERQTTKVQAEVTKRYRGLYKVPVYSGKIYTLADFTNLKGTFQGFEVDQIEWHKSQLLFHVSSPKNIIEKPVFECSGAQITLHPQLVKYTSTFKKVYFAGSLPKEIIQNFEKSWKAKPKNSAEASDILVSDASDFQCEARFDFRGTESLGIYSYSSEQKTSMNANWGSPSFGGQYLPTDYQVTGNSFEASWDGGIHNAGLHNFGSISEKIEFLDLSGDYWQVKLIEPISIYQRSERSTKYGFMILFFVFLFLFIFEVKAGFSLHPVQYGLIGLAKCLYFLLLLSLSEHLGFKWAYLIAAFSSTFTICLYLKTYCTNKGSLFLLVSGFLAIYMYLWTVLEESQYALLIGSLGLYASLAIAMYVTRKFQWKKVS